MFVVFILFLFYFFQFSPPFLYMGRLGSAHQLCRISGRNGRRRPSAARSGYCHPSCFLEHEQGGERAVVWPMREETKTHQQSLLSTFFHSKLKKIFLCPFFLSSYNFNRNHATFLCLWLLQPYLFEQIGRVKVPIENVNRHDWPMSIIHFFLSFSLALSIRNKSEKRMSLQEIGKWVQSERNNKAKVRIEVGLNSRWLYAMYTSW